MRARGASFNSLPSFYVKHWPMALCPRRSWNRQQRQPGLHGQQFVAPNAELRWPGKMELGVRGFGRYETKVIKALKLLKAQVNATM
ncbi:hypothetical protein O203_21285 [Ectopseudomonas chengduensis]|nr:hypothetical protein O203_21285 [Pseudomonas chengduensis]